MKSLISIENSAEVEKSIEYLKGFVCGACEDGTLYFRQKINTHVIELEQKNV